MTAFRLAMTSLLMLASTHAMGEVIMDEYIGADNHGYGDVIGSLSNFQIFSVTATRTGNLLTLSFDTTFAGRGDDHLFSAYTSGQTGIGYGDLFLASAWTPFEASPGDGYIQDNAANGTIWEYGFAVDDRWMAPGTGSGDLYQLNAGDNDANALLSDDFMTGAIFRNGQEVAVDLSSDVTLISGSSFWSVGTSTVDFTVDLTGTSLQNAAQIAFHWGFTCGNDIIEGVTSSVDEPDSLALLGLGLLALGFTARRRTSAAATA